MSTRLNLKQTAVFLYTVDMISLTSHSIFPVDQDYEWTKEFIEANKLLLSIHSENDIAINL